MSDIDMNTPRLPKQWRLALSANTQGGSCKATLKNLLLYRKPLQKLLQTVQEVMQTICSIPIARTA
jgi:hypothetical protein